MKIGATIWGMIIEHDEDVVVEEIGENSLPPTIKQIMVADNDPQSAYVLPPNMGLERLWPLLLAEAYI